jgi:hypothetical protein
MDPSPDGGSFLARLAELVRMTKTMPELVR